MYWYWIVEKIGMELKLVVSFKLNISNIFRITLNNRILSNVNPSIFKKVIFVYTTKYNDHQCFQLFGAWHMITLGIILIVNISL